MENFTAPVLGIVVPCYNEDQVLDVTVPLLVELLESMISENAIHRDSFLALIDDGSLDKTWESISAWSSRSGRVTGLKLSCNVGHQQALIAGLFEYAASADCLISIDADLQDDETVIPEMVRYFNGGCDIVYGVRVSRGTDTAFKRNTARMFYRFMRMMGIEIIPHHADFRLMSRRTVAALAEYREVNLFLRGIVQQLGFTSAQVYYDRKNRKVGTSKYPLAKMLALALDAVTSFSVKPLRLVTAIGILVFGGSIILSVYALVSYLRLGAVQGWTSIVLPMYMLGGIQLLAVGIIGEYLGKIYAEVKHRPRYIIDKRINGRGRCWDAGK